VTAKCTATHLQSPEENHTWKIRVSDNRIFKHAQFKRNQKVYKIYINKTS